MTKLAKTVTPIALLAFALPQSALAWIEFTDMQDFFSINFPSEPTIENIEHVSEYGTALPARRFSVTDNWGVTFTLTVVNFNDAESLYSDIDDKTDDTTFTTMWIYDQRGAVANESARMRAAAEEVLYDGWHHIDRVEGHNLVLRNADDTTTYAALYLHARRLYILEAKVPDGAPAGGLFQQSLSFLDEEGNRIRYWITPEGERSRER
jgi:hypothetical protein